MLSGAPRWSQARLLYQHHNDNMQTFIEKCAKNYALNNEQIKKIKEILEINKRHKQSSMEFVKKDKIVILSDSLKTEILNIQIIKQYLLLAKELLMKTKERIN